MEPHWITEKLGARVMFIEASTPFLNYAKRNQSKSAFVIFAFLFFVLRTLWLGSLVASIWGRPLYVPPLLAMTWLLNQLWLVQIGTRLLRTKKRTS